MEFTARDKITICITRVINDLFNNVKQIFVKIINGLPFIIVCTPDNRRAFDSKTGRNKNKK